MKYVPPLGSEQFESGYRDGNPAEGIPGSIVPAAAIETPQREIVNAIIEAGLSPDADDLKQLARAIVQLSGCAVWSGTQDYAPPTLRFGSDGKLYVALAPSGPGVTGVGAKDPANAANKGFWQAFADFIGIVDTASTADRWTTARSLTLSGDATGAVSLDGSKNVTLPVTIPKLSELDPHVFTFRGTVGPGGTVTALPTSSYRAGWVYRATVAGTYAGKKAAAGDLLICVSGFAVVYSDADWIVLESDLEDVHMLTILDLTASLSANVSHHAMLRYRDWHEHGIEKLIALAQTAETACRRGDASIKAYDQDRQLRRVQLELSKDKVPLLFIVAGQSNAVGCSSKGTYESAADVAQFWDFSSPSGKLSPLKDPVYRSTRGSAWPAFARTVFNLTGRPVYLLNAASSGSAVTDGGYTATNTWADNGHGTLRATAKAAYDAMTASLDAQNLPYQLGGLLWCQGESETGRLMAGTVTRQDYINATKDVFAYFRTVTHSPSLPVFLSKIGYTSTYAANADVRRAYETIQQAQEAICQSESLVHMAFRLAPTFFDIGCMSDSIHYDQRGYNMMGEALARCAASILNLN